LLNKGYNNVATGIPQYPILLLNKGYINVDTGIPQYPILLLNKGYINVDTGIPQYPILLYIWQVFFPVLLPQSLGVTVFHRLLIFTPTCY